MNSRAHVVLAAGLAGLLLAAGLIGLGALLSGGLQRFKATERTVEVKGLAEREVPANLAIWGIQHVDADNELAALYARFESRNAAIQSFLKAQGFDEAEITVSPPAVTDRQARDYGDQNVKLRYSGRSSVTVYTPKVDAVRKALGALGELGKQGVAVSGDGPSIQYV
ncbi:MAG: SIMPL domain-containing protein, partial [Burkholderiaceae bacterium]